MQQNSFSNAFDGVNDSTVKVINAALSTRLYTGRERVLVVHVSADPTSPHTTQVDYVMNQMRAMLPAICNFLYLSHARSEYGIIYIGKRIGPTAGQLHPSSGLATMSYGGSTEQLFGASTNGGNNTTTAANNAAALRKMGAFRNAAVALEMKQKLVRYFQHEVWPPLTCDVETNPIQNRASVSFEDANQMMSQNRRLNSRLRMNAIISEKVVIVPSTACSATASDVGEPQQENYPAATPTSGCGRYFKITLQHIERLHFDVPDAIHEKARWEERKLYSRVLDSLCTKAASYEEYEAAFRNACMYMLMHSSGASGGIAGGGALFSPASHPSAAMFPALVGGGSPLAVDAPEMARRRGAGGANGGGGGGGLNQSSRVAAASAAGGCYSPRDDGDWGADNLDWEFFPVHHRAATTELLPDIHIMIADAPSADEKDSSSSASKKKEEGNSGGAEDTSSKRENAATDTDNGSHAEEEEEEDEEEDEDNLPGSPSSVDADMSHVVCNFATNCYFEYGDTLQLPESTTLDYKSYMFNTTESILERCINFMCGFLNTYGRGKLCVGALELPAAPGGPNSPTVEFNGKPLMDQYAFGVDFSESEMKLLGATLTAQCAACVPPIPPSLIHVNAIPLRMIDAVSRLAKDRDVVQPIFVLHDTTFTWKDNFRAKNNLLMRVMKKYHLGLVHLPNFIVPVDADMSQLAASPASASASPLGSATAAAAAAGSKKPSFASTAARDGSPFAPTEVFPGSPSSMAASSATASPTAVATSINNRNSVGGAGAASTTSSTMPSPGSLPPRMHSSNNRFSPIRNLVDPIPASSACIVFKIIPLDEEGEQQLQQFRTIYADARQVQFGETTTPTTSSPSSRQNHQSSSSPNTADTPVVTSPAENKRDTRHITSVEYLLKAGWKPYDNDVAKQVIASFGRGDSSFTYKVRSTEYRVDFGNFVQTNLNTGNRRSVRFSFQRPFSFSDPNRDTQPTWLAETLEELDRLTRNKASRTHCVVACAGVPIPQLHLLEISVDMSRLPPEHPLLEYTEGKFFSGWPSIPLWDPITQQTICVERDYTLPLVEERRKAHNRRIDIAGSPTITRAAAFGSRMSSDGRRRSSSTANAEQKLQRLTESLPGKVVTSPPSLARLEEATLRRMTSRWRKLIGRTHGVQSKASVLLEQDGVTRRIMKYLNMSDHRCVRQVSQAFNDTFSVAYGRDIVSMLLGRAQFAAFFATQRSMMPAASMQHTVSVIQRHALRIRQHFKEQQNRVSMMTMLMSSSENNNSGNDQDGVDNNNNYNSAVPLSPMSFLSFTRQQQAMQLRSPFATATTLAPPPSLVPLQLSWLLERGGALPAPFPFVPVPLSLQASDKSVRPAPQLIPLYFYPDFHPQHNNSNNNNAGVTATSPPGGVASASSPSASASTSSPPAASSSPVAAPAAQQVRAFVRGSFHVAVVLDARDGYVKLCYNSNKHSTQQQQHQDPQPSFDSDDNSSTDGGAGGGGGRGGRTNSSSSSLGGGVRVRPIVGARCIRSPFPNVYCVEFITAPLPAHHQRQHQHHHSSSSSSSSQQQQQQRGGGGANVPRTSSTQSLDGGAPPAGGMFDTVSMMLTQNSQMCIMGGVGGGGASAPPRPWRLNTLLMWLQIASADPLARFCDAALVKDESNRARRALPELFGWGSTFGVAVEGECVCAQHENAFGNEPSPTSSFDGTSTPVTNMGVAGVATFDCQLHRVELDWAAFCSSC